MVLGTRTNESHCRSYSLAFFSSWVLSLCFHLKPSLTHRDPFGSSSLGVLVGNLEKHTVTLMLCHGLNNRTRLDAVPIFFRLV